MLPALSLALLRAFLALVSAVSLCHGRRLFLEPIGRAHRLAGLLHLCFIILGALAVVSPPNHRLGNWSYRCLLYDICLGALGTVATLTAARSFPHRKITNAPGQSGTLSQEAYVTQGEMIEQSFYQVLNLVQALYLHGMTWFWTMPSLRYPLSSFLGIRTEERRLLLQSSIRPIVLRLVAVLAVTSPWLLRHYFPVHSFSANWIKRGLAGVKRQHQLTATEWLETRLYQIKKWQYVFYKHVILHGLNVSVAFPAVSAVPTSLSPIPPLPLTKSFRIFWICLNTSYVMEFYLQSLVKRRFLSQQSMLMLQRILMTASSISAMLAVADVVRPALCLSSVVLNFSNRGRDLSNVMVVALLAAFTST